MDTVRYLTHMQNAALKMNDIVGNLLLLASMRDTGSVIAPVEMAPVVQAAIERVEDRIAERGVALVVEPNLPTVQGQAAWLEEVFTNLIDNAIKYIGKNNPLPCIRVRGYEQDGKARFEVEDNGVGIPPEAMPKIFEMLTRAHPNEAEGVGLGLSIVRQIIQKLNGEIGVESQPGTGSTFWIALPLARTPQPH
jgi:signal transduction histidine kinase